MSALQHLLLTAAVVLAIGNMGVKHCCESEPSREFRSGSGQIRKRVEEAHLRQAKRLQAYYDTLSRALSAYAPDELTALQPPPSRARGYQTLPTIVPDTPQRRAPSPVLSSSYSWPATEKLIRDAAAAMTRAETALKRAVSLEPAARQSVYKALVRTYRRLEERQQTLDAHVEYNRFWQADVAARRPSYDRRTVLHDAVLERQAILDDLTKPKSVLASKALALLERIDVPHLAMEKHRLLEREQALARLIQSATAPVNVPSFLRLEHRSRTWIFHVPCYTDIGDDGFVRSLKEEVEKIWRLDHGPDKFRVVLSFLRLSANQLYLGPAPQDGDTLDMQQHLARFPIDGAILSTGAITTYVDGRALLLGPHEISPRVLAHEFGHILGFKDSYFRGYRNLGRDGFEIVEITAAQDDIMGAPRITGKVRLHQFLQLLEAVRRRTPSCSTQNEQCGLAS